MPQALVAMRGDDAVDLPRGGELLGGAVDGRERQARQHADLEALRAQRAAQLGARGLGGVEAQDARLGGGGGGEAENEDECEEDGAHASLKRHARPELAP
jgi:hypothetical protein